MRQLSRDFYTKMKETLFTNFSTDNNYSFKHDIENIITNGICTKTRARKNT